VRGSTRTLTWLFPTKTVKEGQQRMVVAMPAGKGTAADVATLFSELVKAWNLRVAREPGTWTARQGPLGSATPTTVTMSDLVHRM
jgi:hypothetical protein